MVIPVPKRPYTTPRLVKFGAIAVLTKSGSGQDTEEGPNPQGHCDQDNHRMSCLSQREAKERIVRIGTHPMGIGLYLFNYKVEHRDTWGWGRQFGVMVDEVEHALPQAVSLHHDGCKMVNYPMLGIIRYCH
jgi:hypothetical protein